VVRRLIVSGICTEQCCETTTRHASDRLREVLARNCSVRPVSTWNAWQNESALPLRASYGEHSEGYTRQPLGTHETVSHS
jgi:nicotinamidase-related amidase